MPRIIIFIGIFLQVIGFIFFALAGFEGKAWTALIPSFLGTIIFICGILSYCNRSIIKHAMHTAMLVSLLGIIGSGMRLIPSLLKNVYGSKEFAQTLTLFFCTLLIVLGIRSFIQARQKKEVE
tara:strand:- start:1438 stop:1806 length:369 start_codon:yes stop_codon:yes gene_type:complete